MKSASFFQQLLPDKASIQRTDQAWLYKKKIEQTADVLSFRMVSLKADLPVMHRWAHHPQAKRFWQMNYTPAALYNHYSSQMDRDMGIVLLCCLNDALPVAQIDVYHVIKDEVCQCYKASPNDYGVHLLMAPYREILSRINLPFRRPSVQILKSTVELLFSFDAVQRIVVEPDRENIVANKLAQQAGFTFVKTITLSYKVANLYHYKRSHYKEQKIAQFHLQP